MSRSANKKQGKSSPGLQLKFKATEFGELKFNTPGPSGVLGGYQQEENWLIEHTDEMTLCCWLSPIHEERVIRLCNKYGDGGPNRRIRRACIPALRRLGIKLEG